MKLRGTLVPFVVLLLFIQACTTQEVQKQAPPAAQDIVQNDQSAAPLVKVTSVSDCHAGPGTAYDLRFSFAPGPAVLLVGKDTADNYWIVENPTGGTCWISGQHAVVTGDTGSLPEMPPPPLPTAGPALPPRATSVPTGTTSGSDVPAAPTALSGQRTCSAGLNGQTPVWVEDITLTWQENAVNENGFHIFQGDTQLTALSKNAAEYHIQLRYDKSSVPAASDTFSVEAFGGRGKSSRAAVTVPRCP